MIRNVFFHKEYVPRTMCACVAGRTSSMDGRTTATLTHHHRHRHRHRHRHPTHKTNHTRTHTPDPKGMNEEIVTNKMRVDQSMSCTTGMSVLVRAYS